MPLYALGFMGMTRRLNASTNPEWVPYLYVALFGAALIAIGIACQLIQLYVSVRDRKLPENALYRIASLIARFERWRQGPKGRSALIEWLSFGAFNKAFKPNRTPFDWLSRDPDEVDAYARDPLCGFRCTNQLWVDLLNGLQQISKASNLTLIDSDLPLLVIGGVCDPVSQGKRLEYLTNALRSAGSQHLQLNLYPQARHELFNEINRDEVTADVIHWLDQALGHTRPAPQ